MDNPGLSEEPTGAVEDPPPPTVSVQEQSTSESSFQQQQERRPPPPLSPLTGSYLLIVVGEPHSERHKEIILQKIAKAFLSWDVSECHVSLEKELQIITSQSPEGEEARFGERLIQYATENLVTEILIHPQLNTLHQCLKNLLSSFTKHRHIIHSGYTFAGNGSWILQDGTLSISDLVEALHEPDVLRVLKAYENSVSIDVHCAPEGDWTTERFHKEPVSKLCNIRVNPGDVMTAGNPVISGFIEYLAPFLEPANIQQLLQPTDVVGNIRFTHPTLYVFPGGQGDAALFGINGFNMLIDGGFARKACFWDFARHLDRLDAVLLTRLNNSTVNGISAVLQRKKMNHVYPQIGHFFCNLQDRKIALSPDGDKDKDSLIVNLAVEGQEIVANLRHLALKPHPCYRDGNQVDPVNLYHKVGHGKLDMYVISPARDSQAVKEFLAKWSSNDSHLFSNTGKKIPGKAFEFPLQNLVSICALLVWQPANPNDTITRILFPGSTPQHKIFEGLEKLRHLEFLKHPVCSAKTISPSASSTTVTRSLSRTRQPKPEFKPKETKIISKPQPKLSKTKPLQKETKPKIDNKLEDEKNELEAEEPLKKLDNRILSKDEQIENIKKEIQKIEQTENEEQKKKIVHRSKYDMRNVKSKVDSRAPSKSIDRKKAPEKKPEGEASPPGTPKKGLTNGTATKIEKVKVGEKVKPGKVSSPTSTPAKSAKEANNRKVVEARVTTRKPATKKKEETPPPSSAPAKTERKPIARRPKAPASPVKSARPGKTEPESIGRKIQKKTELAKTVSQTIKKEFEKGAETEKTEIEGEEGKKEIKKLEEETTENKETETKAVKNELEIAQTEQKTDEDEEVEDEEEEEEEEYLIVTKEEYGEENEEEVQTKDETEGEGEMKKLLREEEESEKKREILDEGKSEPDRPETNQTDKPQENKVETPEGRESELQRLMEVDEGIDLKEPVSKEHKEGESLPEEKMSNTLETSATTAPTLPEDERVEEAAVEVQKDQQPEDKEVIEEKYIQEKTKEEKEEVPVVEPEPPVVPAAIEGTPETIQTIQRRRPRDVVKTPDEVAELPVHEEVDPRMYSSGEFTKELQRKPEDEKAMIKGEANFLDEEQPESEEKNDVEDPVITKYLNIIDELEKSSTELKPEKEKPEKTQDELAPAKDVNKPEEEEEERKIDDVKRPSLQIGDVVEGQTSGRTTPKAEEIHSGKSSPADLVKETSGKSTPHDLEKPKEVSRTSTPQDFARETSGKATPVDLVKETSGKSIPHDLGQPREVSRTSTPQDIERETSGKSTPADLVKGTSGKATPVDLVKETSGKSTPDNLIKEASGKSTPHDLEKPKEVSRTSTPQDIEREISGKTTPADFEKETSGKSTPADLVKEISGKSTPADLVKETSGKSTPAGLVKETSGKSTPLDFEQPREVSRTSTPHDIERETSGKATPVDLAKDISGKATPQDLTKELSGKSTPQDLVREPSGKSTPADLVRDTSGKSTPHELEKLKDISRTSTPQETGQEVSGKSTPLDLAKETSGKSSPQDSPKETSGKETPHDLEKPVEVSRTSTPQEIEKETSGKTTPADIVKDISGKATPLQELSGKSTPQDLVRETSGKSTPRELEKSKEISRASTPQEIETETSGKITPADLVKEPSGKSTPADIGRETSGKSTPLDLAKELSGKSTPQDLQKLDSLPQDLEKEASGKSTPDIKISREPTPHDLRKEHSGKSTPDSKAGTEPSREPTPHDIEKEISGKSTPDSKIQTEVSREPTPVHSEPPESPKPSEKEKTMEISDKSSAKDLNVSEEQDKRKSGTSTPEFSKEVSGKSTPIGEKTSARSTPTAPLPKDEIIEASRGATPEIKNLETSGTAPNFEKDGKFTPQLELSGKSTPQEPQKTSEPFSEALISRGPSPQELLKDVSEKLSPLAAEISDKTIESKDTSGKSTPQDVTKEISRISTPNESEKPNSGISTPLKLEKDISGKSTPLKSEKDISGKSTPEVVLKDISGKSTPHELPKSTSQSPTEKETSDLKKELSGKSTPQEPETTTQAKEASRGASPIQSLENQPSGKSTPEDAVKDISGKTTPGLKTIETEVLEQAGQTRPQQLEKLSEPEIEKEVSGKSTPIEQSVSGKTTPGREIIETDVPRSGKTSPDDLEKITRLGIEKSVSGKSTPVEKSVSGKTTPQDGSRRPSQILSGKATPCEDDNDLSRRSSKKESGSSLPVIDAGFTKITPEPDKDDAEKQSDQVDGDEKADVEKGEKISEVKPTSGKATPVDETTSTRKSSETPTEKRRMFETSDSVSSGQGEKDFSGKSTPFSTDRETSHPVGGKLTSDSISLALAEKGTEKESKISSPSPVDISPLSLDDLKDDSKEKADKEKDVLSEPGEIQVPGKSRLDSIKHEGYGSSGTSTPDRSHRDASLQNGMESEDEPEKGILESERQEKESQILDLSSGEEEELKALGDDEDSEPEIRKDDLDAKEIAKGEKDDINKLVQSGTGFDEEQQSKTYVRRMLVTASSEDGGTETEICLKGGVKVTKDDETEKDEGEEGEFSNLILQARREYIAQRSRKTSYNSSEEVEETEEKEKTEQEPKQNEEEEEEEEAEEDEEEELGTLLQQARRELAFIRSKNQKQLEGDSGKSERKYETRKTTTRSETTRMEDDDIITITTILTEEREEQEDGSIKVTTTRETTTKGGKNEGTVVNVNTNIEREWKREEGEDEPSSQSRRRTSRDDADGKTQEEALEMSRRTSASSIISQEDLVSRKDSTKIEDFRQSSTEMSPLKTTYITSHGDSESLMTSSFYGNLPTEDEMIGREHMREFRKGRGYESFTEVGPNGERTERTYFYGSDDDPRRERSRFVKAYYTEEGQQKDGDQHRFVHRYYTPDIPEEETVERTRFVQRFYTEGAPDVEAKIRYVETLREEPSEHVDFAKAIDEHMSARGEYLGKEYQEDVAKYGKSTGGEEAGGSGTKPETEKKDVIEGWGKPLGLPLPPKNMNKPYGFPGQNISTTSTLSTPTDNSDSVSNWGHPMNLPSPAPPPAVNGTVETLPGKTASPARETPDKEKKILKKNVLGDNKSSGTNTPNRRSESPVKQFERRTPSTGRNNKSNSNSHVYLDLTYVPHHGNSYYSNVEFFKKVRARYYVFSGTEPSKEVYNALLEAKQTWEDKKLEVTIIPTYDTDVLGYWVAENEETLAKHKIDLSPSASRCTINLQDHETSCSAYRLEF